MTGAGSERHEDTNQPPRGQEPTRLRRLSRWLAGPSGVTFLVVAAFVAVGGYWRLEALGQVSLWNDEAQSTIYALSILHTGTPDIVSKHLINNWEPLYPYLEAASIQLLGASNFAYRLPAALLGIALIPLSYLLGRRLRDRYVGIALAAMVTFSTEYIAWSRQARWYSLFILLLAVGLLLALTWYFAQRRRTRVLCLAGIAGAMVLLTFTSIGLFLLYLPGIVVGALAYLVVTHWNGIRRFFTGRDGTDASTNDGPPPRVPYRLRLPLLGLLAVALAIVVAIEGLAIWGSLIDLLTRVTGSQIFAPVWSNAYGLYLVDYYSGITVLACASVYFVAVRRSPLEVGLLAFTGASFVSISVGSSFTNNIASGLQVIVHHITPLLFCLFLLSAITIVEIVRWTVTKVAAARPRWRGIWKAAPPLFAVAVVAMLVVPSAVIPSNQVLNTFKQSTPLDEYLPWVPFSADPQNPWALLYVQQANYQLASEYVLSHRLPGDVVGATTPGPPTVYIGPHSVQYWIRGNPIPGTIYEVNGQPTFFQTGSVLIENSTQFEDLLLNSSGWFISDLNLGIQKAFPGQMSDVALFFMTPIASASDASIHLYHWNRSTPVGLMQSLIHEVPRLNSTVGNYSLQGQLQWAVTYGLTSEGYRPLIVPLAPYLIPHVKSESYRGRGVLFDLYNNRPDLQGAFPSVVTPPYNNSGLFAWGCSVATGELADPAYSILSPYRSIYCG